MRMSKTGYFAAMRWLLAVATFVAPLGSAPLHAADHPTGTSPAPSGRTGGDPLSARRFTRRQQVQKPPHRRVGPARSGALLDHGNRQQIADRVPHLLLRQSARRREVEEAGLIRGGQTGGLIGADGGQKGKPEEEHPETHDVIPT